MDKLERPFVDNCVSRFGWHRVNKAFLEAAGIMNRRDRMPLRHLADADFAEVLDCYNVVNANWEAFLSMRYVALIPARKGSKRVKNKIFVNYLKSLSSLDN